MCLHAARTQRLRFFCGVSSICAISCDWQLGQYRQVVAMTAFVSYFSLFHFLFTFVAINIILNRDARLQRAALRIHLFEPCHVFNTQQTLIKPCVAHHARQRHVFLTRIACLLCSCSARGSHNHAGTAASRRSSLQPQLHVFATGDEAYKNGFICRSCF